ncbi:acyl-CoA dehydrogenase family protein [Ferrovibrio sp. MS7]|uniref:acyl-CoA dehydrogenase family protein n=1 Tax=Ferrovibrio TaxID=1231242 RepID=UPI00313609E1
MPLFNDFGFTDEQKMMRRSLLALAEKHLPNEKIRELDNTAGWPTEAYQAMARDGWLGLPYPEEYGGLGGGYKDIAVLLETLSYHYACLGTTYMTSVIYAGLQLLHNGSEYLKRQYMMPMIKGEIYIAFALTEPQTGSDAAAIKTYAVRDGDDYIIRGQKWFITSAHVADYIVLVVKTDPDAQPAYNGFSMFLVDAKAPGVTIRPIETLGRHTTHTNQIFFDEVRVPACNLIGEENKGWRKLMRGLNLERMSIAACGAGNAQKAIDIAQNYAMERVQFGQAISSHQVIQHKLADMRIKAEVARLVTYRTAEMLDAGYDARMETAICKLVATDNDFDCANIGMQIMGGAGYSMEHDMQRLFRDSRLGPIGGGSNEIQRNIIAKLMGL